MKRREFLKSTLLLAAVSTVVGKAAGLLNSATAAPVKAAPGKLGYKDVSPQADKGKTCGTCKHFKAGMCTLPAMQNAMKSKEVQVAEKGYCNMWAKKA